jgi:nucleoid DNA-binding protein
MSEAAAKKKPLSRTELINLLAERSDLSKQEVAGVLDILGSLIADGIGAQGPGAFTLPGLLKIERKETPAKPARTGVPHPFDKGRLIDVPAKPASVKVKLTALKGLKDMAQPAE